MAASRRRSARVPCAMAASRRHSVRLPCAMAALRRRSVRLRCGMAALRRRSVRLPCATAASRRRSVRLPCATSASRRRSARLPCAMAASRRRSVRLACAMAALRRRAGWLSCAMAGFRGRPGTVCPPNRSSPLLVPVHGCGRGGCSRRPARDAATRRIAGQASFNTPRGRRAGLPGFDAAQPAWHIPCCNSEDASAALIVARHPGDERCVRVAVTACRAPRRRGAAAQVGPRNPRRAATRRSDRYRVRARATPGGMYGERPARDHRRAESGRIHHARLAMLRGMRTGPRVLFGSSILRLSGRPSGPPVVRPSLRAGTHRVSYAVSRVRHSDPEPECAPGDPPTEWCNRWPPSRSVRRVRASRLAAVPSQAPRRRSEVLSAIAR